MKNNTKKTSEINTRGRKKSEVLLPSLPFFSFLLSKPTSCPFFTRVSLLVLVNVQQPPKCQKILPRSRS